MLRNSSTLEINISANELVRNLLKISESENVSFLDSCDVNHLDSHLLIAGIRPLEKFEIENKSVEDTLSQFNKILTENVAGIFTISYDFGLKLEGIEPRKKETSIKEEPDIFISTFDCLIIHDYKSSETYLYGNKTKFRELSELILTNSNIQFERQIIGNSEVSSNFTKTEYIKKIEEIQEYIRKGDTYQTNLTQQFTAKLPKKLTPQKIFWNLRTNHPAPFASFIKRRNDYVLSVSPERFVQVQFPKVDNNSPLINTSPIKGTRPRGNTIEKDLELKNKLLNSPKDRAENIMIVDLLRNDIGRICEFGSVKVEKLCDLEIHPSLFHLVSTVSGNLRKDVNFADIIKAIFPCGSITGCPKIRTMQIIDELETANRGLSMGAIGYCGFDKTLDLNVAIRTMVIRKQKAVFNVGGGIVIDSDPFDEYEESLTKAKALFNAIGVNEF